MYKALGGIFPDEKNPGFKNVILKPQFVSGLEHFEAEHDGPYGKIISSWDKDGEKINYKVVIPPASTATLYLNGSELLESGERISKNKIMNMDINRDGSSVLYLKSGNYSFTIIN